MEPMTNQVFFPVSFGDLFAAWNRFPEAVPYAGGTNLIGRQGNNILNLPPVVLSLDKIEELFNITRTEQYLEIGAMVRLNSFLRLGKMVPHSIIKCVENIACVQVRNLATVGGNICTTSRILDLPVPLIALDAQYELRTINSARWVSSARFHSNTEENVLQKQELLTRIRLPLHQWDYSIYKKFSGKGLFSGETLVILAKTQKNMLSDIRILYKGSSIRRNKSGETVLNGKYLPLNRKTAEEFIENWKIFLANKSEETEYFKKALLNCVEESVFNLSEY